MIADSTDLRRYSSVKKIKSVFMFFKEKWGPARSRGSKTERHLITKPFCKFIFDR